MNRSDNNAEAESDVKPAAEVDDADSVKQHYEQWPFPGREFISREGLLLLRYLQRWLAQAAAKGGGPKVLDVGCGTGHTTLALARNFPDAEFVGIDISEPSLEIARREAERAGCTNLEYSNADITRGLPDSDEFDVVLSLGVMHHIRNLSDHFRHLVAPLRAGGYLVLWFYGQHGRAAHRLNQMFLETLAGGRPGAEQLEIARTFVEDLGQRFAADSGFYTPRGSGEAGIEWLLDNPEWLADQMIPAFEQNLTMTEILQLMDDHGLEFMNWLGAPGHLGEFTDSEPLLRLFDDLTSREQMIAIDYLIKPDYYLVTGRSGSRRE
ncbi:methyltransferase domain-containing protein [Gemmatimonadota bacterium]